MADKAQKIAPATKVSTELKNMMNDAIGRELQVSIQYMWQHVQWGGVKGFSVQEEIKKIAIQEMKHAEAIAERLFYFDVIPTTKPNPIFVGTELKEMIGQDIKDEEGGISLYKQIVAKARSEGDLATAHLFEDILQQEEEHHDTFTTMIEDL